MAPNKSKKSETEGFQITEMASGLATFRLVGTTPLIYNAYSFKAMGSLLLPPLRKNQADRAATLKHDPETEFRSSVYRDSNDKAPTRLYLPTTFWKGAMMNAAVDSPGTSKAQIGRMVTVMGERTQIWGRPKLFMSMVRQAGIDRIPDVRTRAILPQWATMITVRYMKPLMTGQDIGKLLHAAGLIIGVGDFRQQKGKGDYGLFRLSGEDDAEFDAILQQGRQDQDDWLAAPEPYDDQSTALLAWYKNEMALRADVTASAPKAGKKGRVKDGVAGNGSGELHDALA